MHQIEKKVFRDPIYTYITVEDSIIWEAINTKEFQRLRRIKQLGGTFMAFHTADHTRFGHSLGVYELSRRFLESFPEALNELESLTLKCAALLHDIGHGPFSHALESALNINHEKFSVDILCDEKTEVNSVLKKVPNLIENIVATINKTHVNKLLVQLISSQIDLDRMDYILRDAYFCAVPYGNFDLTRIFRVMRIHNGKLVFKESGMHAIEDYMMSRYHMYWQVYYHAVGVSFEILLEKWFLRVGTLISQNYQFKTQITLLKPLFSKEIAVADYISVDEATITYYWQIFQQEDDDELVKLSERLLQRKLFQNCEITKEQANTITTSNIERKTYAVETQVNRAPYSYQTSQTENKDPIMLLMRDGSLKDIAEVSPVIKSVVGGTFDNMYRLFYDGENFTGDLT